MTSEEIKKKLKEIQELPTEEQQEALRIMAKNIGAYYLPPTGADKYTLYHNIHTHLQSEMMLNACVSAEDSSKLATQACSSAKWSCFWAAVAAIAACASVVVMLLLN